ncbi:MAG: peptidylprolyl isomerase [Crocinitomicaceae bacterium]|nr:peptidylprolyl isomerase [Crocinitomicaceae bacterium]
MKFIIPKLFFTLFLVITTSTIVGQKAEKIKFSKGLYAIITTEHGDITLSLLDEDAPLTVANFVGLAEGKLTVFDSIKIKQPFYDGISFHRVIANFMIQGGDPDGNGRGGPGYRFFDETDNGVKHDSPGILSMANAGPNTNGSQFFITHLPTPHLNGKHTVFGRVIQGQEVVDKVKQGDIMQKVKIKRKGLRYKWFYKPSKIFKAEYETRAKKEDLERQRLAKLEAQNNVRLVEAKARTTEEYKPYFLEIIQADYPDAQQTSSGLVYVIEKMGDGATAEKGDGVELHYTGTFVYGGKFDSSLDRGMPLQFDYLIMGLIPGFNEGIALAPEGSKIKLFIPYFLGYGEQGRMPNIPPYADLIFDIELLTVKKK